MLNLMPKKYKKALLIFRRDLRLHDNNALCQALETCERVLPCFIFDPRQYKKHEYFSEFAFKFLLQSLSDLSLQLEERKGRLFFFEGEPTKVINRLHAEEKIDAVFINRDYTPFAKSRDTAIKSRAEALGITLHILADSLLNEPEEACKEDGSPYTVFTPYFKKNSLKNIKTPKSLGFDNFQKTLSFSDNKDLFEKLKKEYSFLEICPAGRKAGVSILNNIKSYQEYQNLKDFPAKNSTTRLSAHNKFGTLSIREVYHTFLKTFGIEHPLIRQLYWRDFFTHIGYHFPHVFKKAFNSKYQDIVWENDLDKFTAWREGRTGFPLVDAGIRELNNTGFMHNRVRMISASFLCKDLHIDWRYGEKYFATKLIDYDACVNNGSWQWAASTGCDAQPYFRIFNPWLQQKKFDPYCLYIKKWLPELREIPEKSIHSLEFSAKSINGYPKPIINHAEESEKAKQMFEK